MIFTIFITYSFASTLNLENPKCNIKNISQYIKYYKANSNEKNLKDIINKKFISKKKIDLFSLKKNIYWLKINLINCDGKSYILNLDNFLIDDIGVYLLRNKKLIKSYTEEYENNIIAITSYNKFAFPLNEKGDFTIYIKIETSFYIPSIKILTKDLFLKKQMYSNMFNTAFYFSLILMFFYNLFIYFVSKIKIYKYYLGYIVCVFGFLFFYDGYFNTLFFKRSAFVGELFFYLFYTLTFICATKFSTFLFQSKRNLFFLNKILLKLALVIMPILAILGLLLSMFNKDFSYLIQKCLLICTIIVILMIITIAIKYYKVRKEFISKIYSFIWIVFMIVSLLFALNILIGFIDTNIMTKILKFNILLEIISMSLFIAYRLKSSNEKNLKLKIKNREQELFILRQTKLASFGEMLHSIAHEWKQPLHRINMISLDIETTYNKDNLTKQYLYNQLNEIELQTNYMNDMINQFMDYFNPNSKTKEDFYLIDCVNDAINLLSIKFSKNLINYKINCFEDKVFTNGYKKEYIQCIIILINNAIDAIINNNIDNRLIEFRIEQIDNIPRLSIIDNAGGIKIRPIEKVFDANVSTKSNNENSGVGLFIAKKIIEDNMNKKLECANYNNGAKFCIIG
ncbi:7TM diverse intracellular signaling domain-containing protein [Arcobacter sp. CECT 8985]|uniref:sensor histidine kinase n=1 Tax=Arcobacter sp. CECT 8985 TaxID=1935424 RepID=UPI001026CBF6|nr:7TM diverse intracellular signaling domain-containing protein [Arcobacter sp. CECT 8985]RXJ84542.1 hypothetical protein CRU93_12480 [Arcobacter sp. CECT 8985]